MQPGGLTCDARFGDHHPALEACWKRKEVNHDKQERYGSPPSRLGLGYIGHRISTSSSDFTTPITTSPKGNGNRCSLRPIRQHTDDRVRSTSPNMQFDNMGDDDFEDLFGGIDTSPYPSQDPPTAENAVSVASDVSDGDHMALSMSQNGTGPSSAGHDKGAVATQIELIFQCITDTLLDGRKHMEISLKRRTLGARKQKSNTQAAPAISSTPIRFPGKTEAEAWRFAVVVRILELIYEAINQDVVLSKRDIYYRDPALFNRQSVVDRYIDDIAFTFGVSRAALNVTAAAKGLINGAINFCRRDGSILPASADKEGILVPNLSDILAVDTSTVRWILVIEKEATFRSVVGSSFWAENSRVGVLVTAKGYPDISTRAILHFLSTPSPQNGFASPPVYALVDYDPDGLAILSTYKHGSAALAHESDSLLVPNLQWLGLRSGHEVFGEESMNSGQGLLTLSTRDRNKARKMLEWEVLAEEAELRQELQTMLMLNMKAELQLLDGLPNAMNALLWDMMHTLQDHEMF